jgi:FkbM family methyltransferase
MFKLPKILRDLRYRLFYGPLIKRGYELVILGDRSYGLQWTICPRGLNASSVVYSGGVGEDISFEHELVKRFGCSIALCDPSPAGLKTMALPENRIPQFRFFPAALTAHSGKLRLAPPQPGEISWSAQKDGTATLEVTSVDLRSLMKQNGHARIDLLKLDIEGCEYEVIDDILRHRIPVRQICVEFHNGIVPGIRRRQTIRSILKLVARGYRLVCRDCANHTFILGSPA